MSISDRSKTDFDRAKIKLTGHFDRRPISAVILSPEIVIVRVGMKLTAVFVEVEPLLLTS